MYLLEVTNINLGVWDVPEITYFIVELDVILYISLYLRFKTLICVNNFYEGSRKYLVNQQVTNCSEC